MWKYIRKFLILCCVIAIIFSGYQLFNFYSQFRDEDKQDEQLIAEIKKESPESSESEDEQKIFTPDKYTYGYLHGINSDYRGWLKWDSNIISTPILQNGNDEEYYLHHNIYGNKVIGGSAFIDSLASLDSQNLTIYGHSVFISNTQTTGQMFSRLRNLESQDYYNSNKAFKIYYENDIADYEVYAVCEMDTAKDSWSYEMSEFENDEVFENWIGYANNHNFIRPDFDVYSTDKFVTFQTCKYREGSERIIVIAKETGRENYQ